MSTENVIYNFTILKNKKTPGQCTEMQAIEMAYCYEYCVSTVFSYFTFVMTITLNCIQS